MPQELTHDDAVTALQKLSPDKQREVLGRLSPEGKKALMAKISAGAPTDKTDKTPPTVKPTFHEQFNEALAPQAHEEAGTGIVGRLKSAAKGAITGVTGTFVHPGEAAEGLFHQLQDAMPAYQMTRFGPIPVPNRAGVEHAQQQAEEVKKHPFYSAASLIAPIALGEATEGLLPEKTTQPAKPGVLRRAVQNISGVGTQKVASLVEDTVGKAGEQADKVRDANKAADERTLEKRGTVDEKNVAALKKEAADRIETARKNREAVKDNAAKTAEVKAENTKTVRTHQKRERQQAEYDKASAELDQKYEHAETAAKAENDNNWNAWRAKIGAARHDMTGIVDVIRSQQDKMDPGAVAEFRSILAETKPSEAEQGDLARTRNEVARGQGNTVDYDRLPPTQKRMVDDVVSRLGLDALEEEPDIKDVPATRLHGWKTQLERAVRTAKDGNVKFAIGKVLDAVRQGEDAVSEESGAGKELAKARATHGPYVETFRNSPNEPPTVASKSLAESVPEHVKEQARQERLEQVARYDPTISTLNKHVQNLRKGLDKLPDPIPLRQQIKPLPEKPTLEPAPKPGEREQYAEPDANKAIERPEVDIRQVRQEAIKKFSNRLALSGYDAGILASSLLAHPLIAMFGAAGESLRVGAVGYVAGKAGVRAALESPRVIEWLSKPSAQDIAVIRKIPNLDRVKLVDGLTQVAVDEAKAGRPIKFGADAASLLGPANMGLILAASNIPKTAGEAKKRAQEAKK